jgi:N-dimethylarginine dimethylaminohydrolase
MTYGVASMTAPLKRVALRAPSFSLLNADLHKWHYSDLHDPDKIQESYSQFAQTLQDEGCELIYMQGDDKGIADAIFTYDASLMTPHGAILMSPGKPLRQGEQELHRTFYNAQNIPILAAVTHARAEAGDTLWLDENTLIVGKGFRTNTSGANQIATALAPHGIACPTFDLPVYTGADACLHLMSLISMLDTTTALICKPLLPVALFDLLTAKGITLIEAPFDEFEATGTLSTNVLCTRPGHVIMLSGIPKTQAAIEAAGIKVTTFDADALCIACEGGPTCLTRPILRGGP